MQNIKLILNFKLLFYILIFAFCILISACSKQADKPMEQTNLKIRQATAAGRFYSASSDELKNKIKKYLAEAEDISPLTPIAKGGDASKGMKVKAMMVPHAGYDYSAPVAAYAYKKLRLSEASGPRISERGASAEDNSASAGKTITAVVICNSHTAFFNGIAVDDSDVWQTPLGKVEVDKKLAEKLVKTDEAIKFNGEVHKADHTLEVQLPFLQTALAGDFKIVPILFGNQGGDDYKKLAKALAGNLGEDDIIIASSDMSHYPNYEDANKIDKETLEIIKNGDAVKLEKHIKEVEDKGIANEETALCGIDGVKTVLEIYRLKNWTGIEILKYANSGDAVFGDKASVVGYGAAIFIKQNIKIKMQNDNEKFKIDIQLDFNQQKQLLDIAKTAVETYVNENKIAEFNIADEKLNEKLGAFVTLRKNGQLRGCIGRIIPGDEPLWQVVRDMAIAAATEDDRFAPVDENELKDLEYEISVLSAPEKIDDWHKIELGKHGVIARKGLQGGVFLPQVASETGWDKEEFLSQLCSQKAGLPPACYKDDSVELKIFTAQVFK